MTSIFSWLVCSAVILATLVVSGEQSNMVKASPASRVLCGFGNSPKPASPSRWPVARRYEVRVCPAPEPIFRSICKKT